MACGRSALAPIGGEMIDQDTQGYASLASIAVWPVREYSAATEPLGNQIRIDRALDQMAGGCDLRPRLPIRQVTARVGGRCVKLQRLQRKIVELRHAMGVWDGSSSFQYTGLKFQRMGGWVL